MDERIAGKIGRYAEEALARIREMTLPQAPYSRLARAWVRGLFGRIAGTEAARASGNHFLADLRPSVDWQVTDDDPV